MGIQASKKQTLISTSAAFSLIIKQIWLNLIYMYFYNSLHFQFRTKILLSFEINR